MTSTVSERARRAAKTLAWLRPWGKQDEVESKFAEALEREFPAYEEMKEFMPKVLAFIVNPQAFDADEMEVQACALLKRLEAVHEVDGG